MKNLLEELVDTVYGDPKKHEKLLRQHARELSPELGKSAHEIVGLAMQARQLERAQAALIVAYEVFSHLSMHREALVAYNDYLRILYVKAEKPQEYVRVLQIADKLTKQALEIQANDLAFISSLLSANCCYFSSQYWPTSAYFAGRDSKERQEKRDSL